MKKKKRRKIQFLKRKTIIKGIVDNKKYVLYVPRHENYGSSTIEEFIEYIKKLKLYMTYLLEKTTSNLNYGHTYFETYMTFLRLNKEIEVIGTCEYLLGLYLKDIIKLKKLFILFLNLRGFKKDFEFDLTILKKYFFLKKYR